MPQPRKQNNREVRERVLILCEGETEPIYFSGIKDEKMQTNPPAANRITIHLTNKNTGRELVKLAKDLKKASETEQNPYDAVWVVIDKDGYTKHPETFNQAKDNAFQIAFSSIAFEYWFLLHFTMTTAADSKADNLIKRLKKAGYKEYDKKGNHYTILKDRTDSAIANARAARKILDIEDTPIYTRNPYTDVDILVEYLMNLK